MKNVRSHYRCACLVVCLAWLVICLLPLAAGAQVLTVRAAHGNLWLIKSPVGGKTTFIYQRATSDPAHTLRSAGSRNGLAAAGGVIPDQGGLGLIYHDLTFQHITVTPGAPGQGRQFHFEPMLPLPRPATLRAATYANGRPWVLLRIASLKTLKAIDTPPTTQPATSPASRPAAAAATARAAAPPAETQPLAAQSFHPVDRLLVLRHGRWQRVLLPADWQTHVSAFMVVESGSGKPTLIRQLDQDNGSRLLIDRWSASGWRLSRITVPGSGVIQPLIVDHQLVIARRDSAKPGITADLFVVRDSKVFPVGDVELAKLPADAAWSLAPVGDFVGLFAASPSASPAATQPTAAKSAPPIAWWTAVNLRGQITQPPTTMHVVSGQFNPYESAQFFVLLVVLLVSVGLMFLFWRRDPASLKVDLPTSLEVAPLSARFLAAVIDLAPVMILFMLLFHIGPIQLLYDRWPGQGWSEDWQSMIPGLLTIGLFVGYTAIAEASTGRTLGKWVMNLEVTTLDGQRAPAGPVVVRCLLKSLDLVAPVLLLLPIINPSRQRLGDMIARTLVVHHRQPQNQAK